LLRCFISSNAIYFSGANGQLLFGIDDGKGGEYFEDIDFPALLKSSVDQELELCKCCLE